MGVPSTSLDHAGVRPPFHHPEKLLRPTTTNLIDVTYWHPVRRAGLARGLTSGR